MKNILLILFLFAFTIQGQFRYYDTKPVVAVGELTNEKKIDVLDAYAKGKKPMWVKHNIGVKKSLVVKLYSLLKRIEDYAFKCMNGIVIRPYEDEAGMFYPKTLTQEELLNACSGEFELPQSILTAILTKMIAYSKKGGKGDWNFYLSQFDGG